MTTASVATAKPLRWSAVRDCPRKAVYEATDTPGRDRTLAEQRQMYRGKSVGHDYVVALATANGWKIHVDSGPDYWLPPNLRADNFETADAIAEMKVAWELGTGHADLYIRPTDTIVEVLSSQNAAADQVRSKLLQARGYARAVDAQAIALAIVHPASLEEDLVVVAADTPEWDSLSVECDERVAQVLAWRNTGEMPERVCGRPGDAWGHFCVYAETCFEGWTPEPLAVLDDPEVQRLSLELAHLKAKRKTGAAVDKLLEKAQKDIQSRLADLVEPGTKGIAGTVKLERSARTRSSFKLTLAKEDSRLPADLLDEFTEVSDYDVWSAELLDGDGQLVAPEEDYGPVPF